jgi:hypothetical protein
MNVAIRTIAATLLMGSSAAGAAGKPICMASPGTLDAGLMVCFRSLNPDTRMSGLGRQRSATSQVELTESSR